MPRYSIMGSKLSHINSPQPQHARDIVVGPTLDDHFCPILAFRERSQGAAHGDRIQRRPCNGDGRLVAQLFPTGSKLAAEEAHVVFNGQAP